MFWVDRWWCILRYHHKSQLAMRLLATARRRWLRLTGGHRFMQPPESLALRRERPDFRELLSHKLAARRANGYTADVAEILQGRFRFLKEQRDLSDPVDWRAESCPTVSLLWRFHLHYHEFLLDLAPEGLGVAAEGLGDDDQLRLSRAWQLVADWIDNNRLDDGRVLVDAWFPYCISRRLPAWILLWSASAPEGELADRVLGSMGCQARFLERHLEWDLRGNHLLENARALVLIGAFLEGPDADRWLKKGAAVFRSEITEQVLPHGEHFERSPMYHALMLEAVLDVRDATETVLPELAAFCDPVAEKMAAFLDEIRHPDGEIPLLGDACFGEAAPAAQLISRAGGRRSANADVAAKGDYWIYRHDADFLLFDAGPVGLDFLPAHAHADLLSFEASIRGRRVFVDSGVFNYGNDAMRRYCRSSAAHNVLMIDEMDQCDMWSRFRMGHRGWPFGFARGETADFRWARAHHDAYRRIGVATVGRWVACRPGGPWLFVDWARGSGSHKLTSRLHLHPDVEAEHVSPDGIRMCFQDVLLQLYALAPGQLTLTTGRYCPQLGHQLECPVVQWTATAELPTACGWCLVWEPQQGAALLSPFAAEETVLRWDEHDRCVRFSPVGKA